MQTHKGAKGWRTHTGIVIPVRVPLCDVDRPLVWARGAQVQAAAGDPAEDFLLPWVLEAAVVVLLPGETPAVFSVRGTTHA